MSGLSTQGAVSRGALLLLPVEDGWIYGFVRYHSLFGRLGDFRRHHERWQVQAGDGMAFCWKVAVVEFITISIVVSLLGPKTWKIC